MVRLAVPLVLLALVAGGCLGQKAAPAPASETPAANATAVVPVNDDGSKVTQAVDTGHMPHMHDYWKGKERVTLFEGDLQPDPENATFASIFQTLGGSVAAGGMLWDLPDGQIVYEGTGSMDLTVTWTDPRVTGMGFIYHFYRGGQNSGWKNGGDLPNGKTFTLPVTPEMTDMPHAKVSKWEFGFGPDKSPGAVLGPFHLKLDIVRTGDIMMFPAHPDLWKGAHELVAFDADHHGAQVSYVKRATQPATQGNFSEDEVPLAKPVPMEAKGLRFVINVTSASSTPGQVVQLGLFVRGADTTNSLRCEEKPLAKVPATIVWEIPVAMEQADSPYNDASDWKFMIEPQTSFTGQDPAGGGTTDTDITWHGLVTATDHALPDAHPCAVNQNGGGS